MVSRSQARPGGAGSCASAPSGKGWGGLSRCALARASRQRTNKAKPPRGSIAPTTAANAMITVIDTLSAGFAVAWRDC
jgi:hypothetical protein